MEPDHDGKVVYGKNKDSKQGVTRAELQEDLQRFTGIFLDRVNQGASILEGQLPSSMDAIVIRQALLYSSNAVEIATGQTPEVNLPDMITFITLSKDRLENFWIPNRFNGHGTELLEEFRKSEKEIWEIASKVATPSEQQIIKNLIQRWMTANPEQVLVERVRLIELSRIAGKVEEDRAAKTEGAFGGIKVAVSTADQGVIVANRAMFLSQKFPYLIRLESRLASKQIITDSLKSLAQSDVKLAQMQQEFEPMAMNMSMLAKEGVSAMREMESLINTYRRNFPEEDEEITMEKIRTANNIVEKLKLITEELSQTSVTAEDILNKTTEEIDSIIWSIAFAIMAIILFLGIIGWGGYYLFVRKLTT